MVRRGILPALFVSVLILVGCAGGAGAAGETSRSAVPLRFATPVPVPTASTASKPSQSTSSAGASPSATPNAATGKRVIKAFLTNFADARPPFHVRCVIGAATSSGSTMTEASLVIEGDAAGDDMRVSLDLVAEGATFHSDMIVLDGKGYLRQPGGPWRFDPGFTQDQPVNPFAKLDASELEYVGSETHNGRKLHHLRTTAWIGQDMSKSKLADAKVVSSTFSIYVDGKGMPVDAVLDFTLTGKADAQPVRFESSVTYEFSDIGKKVRILKPKLG